MGELIDICENETMKEYFKNVNPVEKETQAEIINKIDIKSPQSKIPTIEEWFAMNL